MFWFAFKRNWGKLVVEALNEHFSLDVRDGLQYSIAKTGIHKNNVVIIDHSRKEYGTVAVLKHKFLMPVYIGSEKLGEVKYMFKYIMLFKKMFLFHDDSTQKRIIEIFRNQFAVIKTRPQGNARRKLIDRLHKTEKEVEDID